MSIPQWIVHHFELLLSFSAALQLLDLRYTHRLVLRTPRLHTFLPDTHRKSKLLFVLAVALLEIFDLGLESSYLRIEVQGFVELSLQLGDLLAVFLTKLVLATTINRKVF